MAITFTRTTVNPLRDTASFLVTKPASNEQGKGISYPFTIASADQAQILRISFDYSSSTNYADDDMRVYVYDITNSQLIEVVDRTISANAQGKYVGSFQTNSNSTSYRLIFHVASVNATAYTLKFDNVVVGPQVLIKGAIVTDWIASSVTTSMTTQTTASFVRRVGSNAEFDVTTTFSGASSGTADYTLPLTVDTAKLASSTNTNFTLGIGSFKDASSGLNYPMTVRFSSPNFVRLYPEEAGNTYTDNNSPTSSTIPQTIASGDTYSFTISVPILGWSSNMTLSEDSGNRQIVFNTLRNANQTGVNPNNSYVKVTFNNTTEDTTSSFNTTTNRFIAPEAGKYVFNAALFIQPSNVLGNIYRAVLYKNGSAYRSGGFNGYASAGAEAMRTVTAEIPLVKDDYVEVYLFGAGNNSASTLTIDNDSTVTYFQGWKLSSPQTLAGGVILAVRAINTAGTSIANSGTIKIPLAAGGISQGLIVDTTNNRISATASGIYEASALITFASSTYATGNTIRLDLYKNGSFYSLGEYKYVFGVFSDSVSIALNDLIPMVTGDYLELFIQNSRTAGATLLSTTAGLNYFNVNKIGGM